LPEPLQTNLPSIEELEAELAAENPADLGDSDDIETRDVTDV